MVRRLVYVTAVLVAAVIVFLLSTVPPAPRRVEWGGDPALVSRTVSGAYHVHTTRSDGALDRAAVAAAAARAGLRFVIVTDHGDGTRAPDPPAYLSGVLCLDGVEISTNGGHYVALDLPQAPYPLGGEAAAVVEDVARLGGLGVAAHPDSLRTELAWTDWSLPVDGLEWINADSEWRDEPRARLARALFDYLLRPGPALASMLDRPAETIGRWDAAASRRPVVSLAGHDAHGGIGRGVEDGGRRGIAVPSYEASFRTFSTRVVLDAPLTGDAAADSRQVIAAIRQGRVFTSIDAIAGPGLLDLQADAAGVRAEASLPAGGELVLLRDGVEVGRGRQGRVGVGPMPGAFRVEIRVPGAPGTPPVPWLVSNAVYALPPGPLPDVPVPSMLLGPPLRDLAWHVEHDPSSTATAATTADAATLDYRLGDGARGSQYSALAADLGDRLAAAPGLAFRLRASRPMRVSVQGKAEGESRWGQSVYVGTEPRDVRLRVDEMLPLDGQTGRLPNAASIRALLFVVDLTNARPGDSGTLAVGPPSLMTLSASVPAQSPRERR